MRHIKVFVSSTKAHEIMSILNGVTKQMMIPVRMFDSGVGKEGSGQMWIKFEVCDDSLTWDDLTARIDTLNDKTKWAMPCKIELYGLAPEGYEVVHTNED
mgnify:CR=1 FL=1|tara:strand:+ start:138 stop:437 length:300 start_codon:yes stop_codon:yes gene_type:complete